MKKLLTLVVLYALAVINVYAQAFITTWKTDNPGTSTNTQITIPTLGLGYNYNIYWEEVGNAAHNGIVNNVMGNHTIEFGTPGTYRVEITGAFPRFYSIHGGDKSKILTVEQWGNIAWSTMQSAFDGCNNLTIPATDAPDLSNVTSTSWMFNNATSFNEPVNHWDVSGVTTMISMFNGASSFNQLLDNWDVSNVTDMRSMLHNTSFNKPLSNWNVSNVTYMSNMLDNSNLSSVNYDATLQAWAIQNVKPGVVLGASTLRYCAGEAARNTLINTFGWIISGDNKNCSESISFTQIPNKIVGDPDFELAVSSFSGRPVTLVSSNESVATLSGKTVTIRGKGTTSITASLAADAYYSAATSIQRSLTVKLYNQTISFNELPNKTFGDSPFTIPATASSNLPITYTSSNFSVATISGNTITIHGAGAATITAFQSGNDDYNPAPLVNRLLTVAKADQTITFNQLAERSTLDEPFELKATASSNLSVTYSSSNPTVATISGSTVTMVGAGVTTITALQSGDANYNAAPEVQQILTVKLGQTIAFNALPNKTIGDAPFAVSALASSGLPVLFSAITNNISLSGNTVSLLAPGQATLQATQTGNPVYAAALPVDQTFCINPAKPTISVSGLGTGTTVLTSSATGGNVWYLNGIIKETTPTDTHTVTQAGVYTASAIIDGCLSEPSDPVALIVTEAELPLSSLVSVYPNPVQDILNIDVRSLANTTEVSLYDVAGRLVATTTGTQLIQVNTQALALGIYLVYIKNEQQVITQRISKQ